MYFPSCLIPEHDVAQKNLKEKAGVFSFVLAISVVEIKELSI
jgi:hypothetical protein